MKYKNDQSGWSGSVLGLGLLQKWLANALVKSFKLQVRKQSTVYAYLVKSLKKV